LDGSEIIPGVKDGATVSVTADALAGLAATKVLPSGSLEQDRVRLKDGSMFALVEAESLQNLSVAGVSPSAEFRGRQVVSRVAPTPRPDFAYSADHTFVLDKGATINGPLNAAYGRTTVMFKEGYPFLTARYGEMDSFLVKMRQAGPTATSIDNCSDQDAFQVNLRQSGHTGFSAAFEANVGMHSPSAPFADEYVVSTTVNVFDSFGKNQEEGKPRYLSPNPLSFGFYAGADKGKCDRAFYAANGSEGYWDDLLYLKGPNGPVFRVKGGLGAGVGTILIGDDNAGYAISINTDGNLQIATTLGAAMIISQNKVVSFDGTIAVARIIVAGTETLTSRGTLTLPHLNAAPTNPQYMEIANFGGKAQQWDGTSWRAFW